MPKMPSDAAFPQMMPAERLKWAAVGWVAGSLVAVSVLAVAMKLVGSSVDVESSEAVALPIGWIFAGQIPLWLGLLGAAVIARRDEFRKLSDWPSKLARRTHVVDIPIGVAVGVAMQLVLVPVMYTPVFWILSAFGMDHFNAEYAQKPAQELIDKVSTPFGVALLVLMTVVMAPIVEEVFYRGLLQGALLDRFGPVIAVSSASLIFALTHFQLLQFPALLMVGAVHGLMLHRTGRLVPALASHASFNAVTVLGLLQR